MDFVQGGVSVIGLKEGEELTLITTANTIGPRVSPIFTPESMAATKLQLWIHEKSGVGW